MGAAPGHNLVTCAYNVANASRVTYVGPGPIERTGSGTRNWVSWARGSCHWEVNGLGPALKAQAARHGPRVL